MIETVALNLITYNEGHRIFQTLWNASQHVDEVVIVDQSSTDNTIEEIESYRERFFPNITVIPDKHWGWCEPSRKKAWQNTNSEWILVLDADERISDDFAFEMRSVDDLGYRGCRLKRSLYVGGEHRFTGDYQYRYFRGDCVSFLKEIHTEPQPKNIDKKLEIYSPPYVGIIHEKSWKEVIRDEEAYEQIIPKLEGRSSSANTKLSLNVHLDLLRSKGISAEEADAMTIEERNERGIGAG